VSIARVSENSDAGFVNFLLFKNRSALCFLKKNLTFLTTVSLRQFIKKKSVKILPLVIVNLELAALGVKLGSAENPTEKKL
jgi:hypothetical protein